MANKVTLGARPKTFKTFDVKVTMPDGEEGVIPVTYKYRTKSEFGKWLDAALAAGKKAGEKATPEEFSWEKFYEQNIDTASDQLISAVDSWGLDVPLSRDSLRQMGDEIPGAITAMLSAYGEACREGRLGN